MLDRLGPNRLAAVVGMLEAILDPVSRAIASAPKDDEPETEQERRAANASKAWFDENGGRGIAHEEILAEFGPSTSPVSKSKQKS